MATQRGLHVRAARIVMLVKIANTVNIVLKTEVHVAYVNDKIVGNDNTELLYRTTNRNNIGIKLEKGGKIEDAIKVYEENVKAGFPATHSFNRLIVLYKRLKRPLDEKRVCEEYIKVFSVENGKRYQRTIKKYPEYKNEIAEAHRLNTSFKGYSSLFEREVVLFNPYPILKYMKRLEKINLSLTQKQKS